MKEVLEFICDIEEKANSIIDHTSVEKKALHEQMTKEINSLIETTKNTTKEKLSLLQEKMRAEISEEHRQLIREFELNYQNLSENFEKNQNALVDSLFEKIIGE